MYSHNSNLGSTYGYISDLDVPDVILGVYDVNSANSPYKKGLTQATAGNNTWGEWMAK